MRVGRSCWWAPHNLLLIVILLLFLVSSVRLQDTGDGNGAGAGSGSGSNDGSGGSPSSGGSASGDGSSSGGTTSGDGNASGDGSSSGGTTSSGGSASGGTTSSGGSASGDGSSSGGTTSSDGSASGGGTTSSDGSGSSGGSSSGDGTANSEGTVSNDGSAGSDGSGSDGSQSSSGSAGSDGSSSSDGSAGSDGSSSSNGSTGSAGSDGSPSSNSSSSSDGSSNSDGSSDSAGSDDVSNSDGSGDNSGSDSSDGSGDSSGSGDDSEFSSGGDSSSPAANSYFSQLMFSKIVNLTDAFRPQIEKELGFCIKDAKVEMDMAFNFSSDPTFMANCLKHNQDLSRRICTAAEVTYYFNSFLQSRGPKSFIRPNLNCNLTTWVAGCEPGWACSVPKGQKVNLKDDKNTPVRNLNCRACCEGFFCPEGLTCMIPCPLGSYCPIAKLNGTTGLCEPYDYQLPPGQPNHTCGGADKWADVLSSRDVFCPAGYYCPSTIKKLSCSSGHYCRMGSTYELKCFNKGSCKQNSTNQDITVFGILLMVALSLLLLIIYNFSGQLLTNRERKQAKSREAAARMARETAQAREKWKSAKDVAKKHAVGLQSSLSRTFSRTKSKGFGRFRTEDGNKQPTPPTVPPSTQSNDKGPGDLTKMVHSIDENVDNEMGFHIQVGDKHNKKHAPKGKQMHTRSQIFKYAYGQIEKEKAMEQQTKNMSFSGVISMATDDEIRSRPVMEVAFKDLTLSLRGNGKKLLKYVTGKLMPGRVAALMGPSGAGKTTFLNALSGKVTGCETTGSVLINGKVEPISAYRKIIGFVPQDDIVHGDLTVEENLWFSARCRLSADMEKADKVLVVERVIESLGLQAIRDSLVGTVEKRGISGGQRKRVNVGLEMVMEPSLLILDEPTSGLDSSSSNLLLKALKREALEGVNICMVVHQPSYALFKMFDDLILLAKGGITAYHGSVKKVEEYFSGLGINVPERVNPPDYFIDILEGIVKPQGVNVKQLPLKWMQHNGYPIPPDVLQLLGSDDSSEHGSESSVHDQSASDIELKIVVASNKVKQDEILEKNFSKHSDFSNRRTPGVYQQNRYFLGRVCKQRLREARIQISRS